METLLAVVISMVLTGMLIEAAFRIYDSFTDLKKEKDLYHPDHSHPSGNMDFRWTFAYID